MDYATELSTLASHRRLFSDVVGPYDHWAIEYGYKPSGAVHPLAERRFLEQIASFLASLS